MTAYEEYNSLVFDGINISAYICHEWFSVGGERIKMIYLVFEISI